MYALFQIAQHQSNAVRVIIQMRIQRSAQYAQLVTHAPEPRYNLTDAQEGNMFPQQEIVCVLLVQKVTVAIPLQSYQLDAS